MYMYLPICPLVVAGTGIQAEHCMVEYSSGGVVLHPLDGKCHINHVRIRNSTKLTQGIVPWSVYIRSLRAPYDLWPQLLCIFLLFYDNLVGTWWCNLVNLTSEPRMRPTIWCTWLLANHTFPDGHEHATILACIVSRLNHQYIWLPETAMCILL